MESARQPALQPITWDNGAETVKQCLVGEASKHVKTVLEETVESFV